MDMPVKSHGNDFANAHWLAALSQCPPESAILAVGIDLAAINEVAPGLVAGRKIDWYQLGTRYAAPAAPPQAGNPSPITECGEWRALPGAKAKKSFAGALVDVSRVSSNLAEWVESIEAVLRQGCPFACVVPFGWKRDSKYPYLLSESSVIRLMRAHGFFAASATTLPDLVHGGYACALVGTLDNHASVPHFDESRWMLSRFSFVPHSDPSFTYAGNWSLGSRGERIARGATSVFTWQGEAEQVLVVCERHPWSGIAEFQVRGRGTTINLFNWFAHTQPEQVFLSNVGPRAIKLTGRPCGADRDALGSELVIHGVLWR
jgi:hypothetical protein